MLHLTGEKVLASSRQLEIEKQVRRIRRFDFSPHTACRFPLALPSKASSASKGGGV
jgi:hypothetical protein